MAAMMRPQGPEEPNKKQKNRLLSQTPRMRTRRRQQTRTRRRHTNEILVVVMSSFWAMLLGLVDANDTPLVIDTPSDTAIATATDITTQRPRRRTQENKLLTLSLDFSLWFPYTGENELAAVAQSSDTSDSDSDVVGDNTTSDLFLSSDIVAGGVSEALLELLCTATDMNVMDRSDQDVCVLHDYTSKQQSRLPTTILQEDPRVSTIIQRRQQFETLLPVFGNTNQNNNNNNNNNNDVPNKVLPNKEYYEWTVEYILVQLSDTYLQQATTTTTTATINAEELAMRTMEQSIQLALDLSIMEGDFDLLLAKHMPPATDLTASAAAAATGTPIAVYSSPTGREATTFGKLAVNLLLASSSSTSTSSRQDMMSRYETDVWNPMRTSGLALLGGMLLLCTTLGLLAGRRRTSIMRTLEQTNDTKTWATTGSLTLANKEDTTTAFMLQSPEDVDSFLNQSASFRTRRSKPSGSSHDSMADGDLQQDEDDEEPRIPLPFQLQ